MVGRNAILRDPAYQDGQYYANGAGPAVGLSLARMLGHITYLSREAMMQKFDAHRLQPRQVQSQFETRFSVGSYLAYQGDKFVERFDANSYLALTMAIDLFDLGDTPGKLAESLRASRCRWLLVSFSSDWLFPPFQSREMVDALIAERKPVSLLQRREQLRPRRFPAGRQPADLRRADAGVPGQPVGRNGQRTTDHGRGRAVSCQLSVVSRRGQGTAVPEPQSPIPSPQSLPADTEADDACWNAPTSIFHRRRLDYDSIVELVPRGPACWTWAAARAGCWPGSAAAAAARPWASNWMNRPSWPVFAAGWT